MKYLLLLLGLMVTVSSCTNVKLFSSYKSGECFQLDGTSYIVLEAGKHSYLVKDRSGHTSVVTWSYVYAYAMQVDCFGRFKK